MEKTYENCALFKVRNPNLEDPCVGWTESAESLQQRHQQLEQVARETGFEREYLCQYPCVSCNTNAGYLATLHAEAEATQRCKEVKEDYERLKQVAREMWFRLKDSADSCNAVADSTVEICLDQLTEMGVDVDGD